MSAFENEQPKDDREQAPPVLAPAAAQQAHGHTLTRDDENVIWNLQVLESGDHKILAQVLADHPDMREEILTRAAADLGNDTVAKALGVLAGVPEPEAPSEKAAEAPAVGASPEAAPSFDYTTSPLALEYDEAAKVKDHADFMRANPQLADQVLTQTAELDPSLATAVILKFDAEPAAVHTAPAAKEETPPAVVEEGAKAAVKASPQPEARQDSPKPATAEEAVEVKAAPEPEKESGWVSRAREYHQEHPADVALFMAATGGACIGPEGVIDPNLVAQWQVRNGVAPDGRIGDSTNAAAILAQPVTYEEAAKIAEDDNLPEPDPTDPRFAL